MSSLTSLKALFRPPRAKATGISILFLQAGLQRFTDEELCLAMQRGWRKPYDPVKFYGMSIFDGEGGLLKYNDMFFSMQHFDRRVDAGYFAGQELPSWAAHSSYSSFGYKCPEGIPAGEIRDNFYCLLGLFCAELLGENTRALLFVEDQVILRYDSWLIDRLRSGKRWNPAELSVGQSLRIR